MLETFYAQGERGSGFVADILRVIQQRGEKFTPGLCRHFEVAYSSPTDFSIESVACRAQEQSLVPLVYAPERCLFHTTLTSKGFEDGLARLVEQLREFEESSGIESNYFEGQVYVDFQNTYFGCHDSCT
jgi:hypothetical protein